MDFINSSSDLKFESFTVFILAEFFGSPVLFSCFT
jgi:hypothetical protein